MFATLKGICYQCKIERLIPVMRDGFGICVKCNRQIERDIDAFKTTQCAVCGKSYSPLWGEINDDGNFQCRNCLPEGICDACFQPKRLPFVGQDENGYFLFCKDCQDENEEQ